MILNRVLGRKSFVTEGGSLIFVVIQLLTCVRLFMTPWTAAPKASLSFTVSWSLFRFMSINLVMPSNHLILCHPLLLLPSVFPSIRVFSSELALYVRWPKYWSFPHTSILAWRIPWTEEPNGLQSMGLQRVRNNGVTKMHRSLIVGLK